MARNNRVIWDWEVFRNASYVESAVNLWSRFPVELGPDLIVCPHLFDWPAGAPRGRGAYTCAAAPEVVVFSARGEAHRRFLTEEVVPRVHEHVRFVALVDCDADHVGFAPLQSTHWLPAEHLAPLLRIAYGHERIPYGAFGELGRPPESGIERTLSGLDDARPEDVARLEQHPIRLWEAFFWRGHAYRYELVEGEVPLVGDLRSPLAANRTLMQLVRDAERLEGERAGELDGWIRCGRFRLRQLDRLVEARARLSPADVRAAFLPQARAAGASELPSVLGALMAGGDNGKTELWNGFTWSSIELASAAQSLDTAHALREELEGWTDTKATVIARDDLDLPKESREEWFLVPYEKWLTVYVPFAREDCLPWEVHAGDFWQRGDEGGT